MTDKVKEMIAVQEALDRLTRDKATYEAKLAVLEEEKAELLRQCASHGVSDPKNLEALLAELEQAVTSKHKQLEGILATVEQKLSGI